MTSRWRYAVRLNAFRAASRRGLAGLLEAASGIGGVAAADLNYPDHLEGLAPADAAALLERHELVLNGLAMRYYSRPEFRLGAFTHPDRAIRRAAIDLTRRGIDALREMGGGIMTIWPGQDGVDYALQADPARMWDDTVAALAEIADHDPTVPVSVEYKPDEPRAHALLRDAATTLLALREANRPNLGATLDFAHALYAGEIPAEAAMLIARHARLDGVHLNDGYGRRDDGLMAGSVHPVETLGLFMMLDRIGYRGVIYFDTFPDHGGLDPVEEARMNIAQADRLASTARALAGNAALAEAQARQDAASVLRIVGEALYR